MRVPGHRTVRDKSFCRTCETETCFLVLGAVSLPVFSLLYMFCVSLGPLQKVDFVLNKQVSKLGCLTHERCQRKPDLKAGQDHVCVDGPPCVLFSQHLQLCKDA